MFQQSAKIGKYSPKYTTNKKVPITEVNNPFTGLHKRNCFYYCMPNDKINCTFAHF